MTSAGAAGGQEHGLLGLVKVCEHVAAGCASTALCFGMHCVGSAVINAKATEAQAAKFLNPICAGNHLTTLALSEPGTGSHFYIPETTLLVDMKNNSLIVNGKKIFVTNGGHADSYVISTMASDPDAPPNNFSCCLITSDLKNVQWVDPWSGIGMRGNSSCGMRLDNVQIPIQNLLGSFGDQLWYIFNVVAPYFLASMSGTYLGIAQASYNEARNHLKKRVFSHTGSGLSSIAVLQHKLGVVWSELERSRQLIYYAAKAGDLGSTDANASLFAAKANIAVAAVNIVNECMTICGGSAYRGGTNIERALRDVRAAPVMSPTTDILYTWIGRDQLGLPILGDE